MPSSTKPVHSVDSRTPEQLANAAALHACMMEVVGDDLAALSALLATKTDATMFGAAEFQVRDLVHAIGASADQDRDDGVDDEQFDQGEGRALAIHDDAPGVEDNRANAKRVPNGKG